MGDGWIGKKKKKPFEIELGGNAKGTSNCASAKTNTDLK